MSIRKVGRGEHGSTWNLEITQEGYGEHERSSIPIKKGEDEEEEVNIHLKVTKTVTMKVKKSDTVKNLKTKFSSLEDTSSYNWQDLFYSGVLLRDSERLGDCGVMNNSPVQMYLGSMKILVKILWNGTSRTLEFNYWHRVYNVRMKVQSMESIVGKKIAVIHAGKELDDDLTLSSQNIMTGSTLLAGFRGGDFFQIHLHTLTGQVVELDARSWYSVEYLKIIIGSLLNIPSNQQKLLFGRTLLQNHKRLLHYKIKNASRLTLVGTISLFVQRILYNQRFEIEMDSQDTIGNVKKLIENKHFIPQEKQQLRFDGLVLKDYLRLDYYNIKMKSTLHLLDT